MKKSLFTIVVVVCVLVTSLAAAQTKGLGFSIRALIVEGEKWVEVICPGSPHPVMAIQVIDFGPVEGTPGPATPPKKTIDTMSTKCAFGEVRAETKTVSENRAEPRGGEPCTMYFSNEILSCKVFDENGKLIVILIPPQPVFKKVQKGWQVKKDDKLTTTWGRVKNVH